MKRLLKDTSGSMAIQFGIMATVFVAGLACAIDLSLWQSQKSKLQDAADVAALAGAVRLGNGGRNVEKYAEDQATEFATNTNDTTLDGFQSDAIVDALAETVQVDLSVEVPRIFSYMLKDQNPRVAVSALAQVVPESFYCIFALNPTASGAINGNGNALLEGTDCSIQVNSTATNAISNSGTITADEICVAGGASGTGYTPYPTTNCAAKPDPMAHVNIPSAGVCNYTGLNINTDMSLSPGTYCGGIKVSGSDTDVTLAPGEYFIVDGDLKISGGGSVTGDEVVFVLSGTASMDISGTGVVSTTPPISGDLEGFSIVQHRSAPLGKTSKITGEGRFEFPGIIYLPNQALDIAGRAVGNTYTPSYAAIIVNTLKVSGSGELKATADSSAFSGDASSRLANASARLVE